MITLGYIEKVYTSEGNPYKVKVRMPIFDKIKNATASTPTEELQDAVMCTITNSKITPNNGDTVVISFLDNDISSPIILGWLYANPNTSESDTFQSPKSLYDLYVNSIATNGTSSLGESTSIGEVTPDNIKGLKDCDFNIKAENTRLSKEVASLNKKVSKLETLLNNQIQLNSDMAVMSMVQQRELQEICRTFDKLHHTNLYELVGNKYPTEVMTRFTDKVPSTANGNPNGNVGEQMYDIKWRPYVYNSPKTTNIDGSRWGHMSFGDKYKEIKG